MKEQIRIGKYAVHRRALFIVSGFLETKRNGARKSKITLSGAGSEIRTLNSLSATVTGLILSFSSI